MIVAVVETSHGYEEVKHGNQYESQLIAWVMWEDTTAADLPRKRCLECRARPNKTDKYLLTRVKLLDKYVSPVNAVICQPKLINYDRQCLQFEADNYTPPYFEPIWS